MNTNNLIQCLFYVVAIFALAKPVGWYMAKVYEGQMPGPARWLVPFEGLIYQNWGRGSSRRDGLENIRFCCTVVRRYRVPFLLFDRADPAASALKSGGHGT